jgi:ribonuclease D
MAEHRMITTAPALDDLVAELVDQPRYAVDTEFHRERTYYPKIALVQIAWEGGLALVDPLAVSLQPLAKVLAGDGLAVMHAATQDLEVLDLACDTLPSRLFDTQLAAGFLGLSTPSLASLADRELRVRLPKGDRLTDWLARPLRVEQLDYAAADVAHLLELHDRITAQLEALGRLAWAEDECEELRAKGRPQRDPEDAWRRIKEVRQLRGNARSVGRRVAAWREERAMQLDLPVRFVLADLAIVAIAQRAPKNPDDLKSLRGLDVRQLGATQTEALLEVVRDALANPPVDEPTPPSTEVPRDLRPAVTLVSAWVGQLANDFDLDPSLLGTRADIDSLLRGDDSSRLASGWRAELVGETVKRLVAGEIALAFENGKGLVVEPRFAAERRGNGPSGMA